jgi:imidazoleglycerol-phosphate dehydratase
MISKQRTTKETEISVELDLNGSGKSSINTGVGFFDHMLEAFSKHALIDLDVSCKGDTHIDDHHSVEDVGIVIGQALAEAIYPIEKVERFGNATVVMDVVLNARITAHIVMKRGRNKHHILEAAFKAFAVALRRATAKNERTGIPSTKGVL